MKKPVCLAAVVVLLNLHALFADDASDASPDACCPTDSAACCPADPDACCPGVGEEVPFDDSLPPWMESLMCRSKLTGDWRGARSSLAESGITFEGDLTQYYQGVASGGIEQVFKYGGHADYVFNLDVEKLGGMKGGFVKIRAEHNFGETVNGYTGALLPVAINPSLPTTDSRDVYLTDVLFMQFLSEKFGVYFGKMDTLDGDANAFAHGRGKSQFLNTALMINPALLRSVPYSTLGMGAMFLLGPEDVINFGIINATDTTRTSGFGELFEEGVVLSLEGRFSTSLFNKPGHLLFGATWNSREYVSIEQDPRIVLPGGDIPIARTDGTWALYWNFDQYVCVYSDEPRRGWGVFGRAAITDGNPNPIQWFLSLGVGGNSPIRCRENDTFGIGWYLNGVTDKLGPVVSTILATDDGQGVELYYNIAVTPWLQITPDIQYVHPSATNRADDALVLGIRANMAL